MKNGKVCFGVIIGTRAYFNSELAKDVKKQLLKTLDEKDEYFNFPSTLRQSFLDYLVANDATFYLAGHTHTTLERDYRGVPILNGETTSRNFDRRDFGFRLLKIDEKLNFTWDFVEVQKNVAAAKS